MRNIGRCITIILLGLLTVCCSSIKADVGKSGEVTDYASCVAAGYHIVKTYPPRCISKEGRVFFQQQPQRPDGDKVQMGGICKNMCGDGVCQQIVCMGSGCPCAETPANCPKDCAQDVFR